MYNAVPHHGMVSEYQGSGIPFVSSSAPLVDTTSFCFTFPYVSRHFTLFNSGSTAVRVGFTQNGVDAAVNSNYFILLGNSESPRLEIKTDKVYFRKDEGTTPNVVSIVAGITNIPRSHFIASGLTGSNGVVGVG